MPHRRFTDVDKTQEIESLIMNENDPKYRTLLLVVHSLNTGIRENTAAQKTFQTDLLEHQKRLDIHLQEYRERAQTVESFINQGKGVRVALGWGWRIVLGLFAVMQTVIFMLASYYIDEMTNLRQLAQENAIQHAAIFARMAQDEKERRK